MEARCGGLAVVAVRRPLQPRDTNVVASPAAALAGKAAKGKGKGKGTARAASSPPSVRSYAKAGGCRVGLREVSLAEELEKARERRGRMRAAREVTERALEERAAALRREAREWERRADEQRRLVAELMRLIGMPEVYTPVESLRSKEERKRKEGIAHSGSILHRHCWMAPRGDCDYVRAGDYEPCTAPPCQGKQTWPELLGKDQDTAYDTIKRENPQVTNIVYLISNSIGREENDEFCCNRVVLVIGALPTGGEGISKVPQVG
uniref:Uncharacterized protein n=1 Tax=Oryza glaberrima TaxID=4538 RepID=I1PUE1_ORYGL